MIKSTKTKVRIEQRREGKKRFDRSTKWGKQCYREWLRGIDVRQNLKTMFDVKAWEKVKREVGMAQ